MPEEYINEFTLADGIDFGDEWPIQRKVGGVWKDYVVPNENMFGVDVRTKTATYDIQDILSSAQVFESAPAAGSAYVVLKASAIYRPGSINDGFDVQLLGKLNYESGGNKAASCRFIFSSDAQGSPLYASDEAFTISGNTTWSFAFGGDAVGCTSNGTITVWAMYAILPLL